MASPTTLRPRVEIKTDLERKLTQNEIEKILDAIPDIAGFDDETVASIRRINLEPIRLMLSKIEIFEEGIEDLKEGIITRLRIAKVRPGTNVGHSAAEAIMAPVTQLALNFFHIAGSAKNIAFGVARIEELINATENPKTEASSIFFKDQDLSIMDIVEKKQSEIVGITVEDVISDFMIEPPSILFEEGIPWW